MSAVPGPLSALSPSRRRETLTAFGLVLPALLGFVLFYAWPAWRAVEISLTDWNLLREPNFVGLDNYVQMWGDERFWHGMKLSAWYVAFNIPVQTVLGLFLAVVMDRLARSLFVKAVVLLPYLLSNVLVALMWLWLLDPLLGGVNALLTWTAGRSHLNSDHPQDRLQVVQIPSGGATLALNA